MAKKKVELRVFNPRGKVESIPPYAPSRRIVDLAGKKIGILKFGTGVG